MRPSLDDYDNTYWQNNGHLLQSSRQVHTVLVRARIEDFCDAANLPAEMLMSILEAVPPYFAASPQPDSNIRRPAQALAANSPGLYGWETLVPHDV